MTEQIDPEELITIDFTPREILREEQDDVQFILDRDYPGHVLVVPDSSDDWLVRELIDRGIPPEEVDGYLQRHPNPFQFTVPRESQSLSSDRLAGICAAIADPETADPETAGDDCTQGSEGDEVPDLESDLRIYRVRRGFVDDGVEPYSRPTLPVVIAMRGDGEIIAIT